MKFLADECCDAHLVRALRMDGHDVLYVIENFPGTSDDQILNTAHEENRILLTEDKDFGELVHRLKLPSYGIVLLRFEVTDHALKVARIRELIASQSDRIIDSFIVVEADKVRIRPLRIR